jgi:hypothetical protein
MAQYILQNEPQAQLGIQFTWSYEKGFWPCDGANDAERWANQMKVYNNIYANTLRAAKEVEAAVGKPVTIVPTGYVVQYARLNYDRFNTTLDKKVYNDYNTIGHTQADGKEYNEQVENSFFYSVAGNTMVNDYIDLLAFNSNPEKQISFADEFNKLMSNGNMFRGDYEGAFVTTIASVKLPIAYFGRGYDAPFTIVHEFGHYMNEVYSADVAENSDEFDQSYDLLEMHSQGNELLYLCYLKENAKMGDVAHRMVEAYSLVNMLYAVMAGMTIDSFEQAIYLDTYDGPNADQIMADGTITADEYGLLYSSVCSDYGVRREVGNYWEYGMTITSPCYYISYSVSAISVLQLYEMANTDGFDAAKDAYLKLFTYVDEDPGMSMEEVLTYAGMLSFNNEQLYINLNKYFIKE